MKKWILGLFLVLIIVFITVCLSIPAHLTVSSTAVYGVSAGGAERFVLDSSKWSGWWTNENSVHFRMSERLYKAARVHISCGGQDFESLMSLVATGIDSTAIQWHFTIDAGSNPLKRFLNFMAARKVKYDMDRFFNQLKPFIEKSENIYGFRLERTSTQDTLLISQKSLYTAEPGTAAIYEHIRALQAYATENNAVQTGNPIYNITREGNQRLQLMVAIPVNKILPDRGDIQFKRMIPGSFIVTEARGGESKVEEALNGIHQYFADYGKVSMAINFRMLVTDRLAEPDSSKWITKIYQPVY